MSQGDEHLQQPPNGRLILGVLHEAVADSLQHRARDKRLTCLACMIGNGKSVAVYGAVSSTDDVRRMPRLQHPHHDVLQTI
jgi:hypothetical protein